MYQPLSYLIGDICYEVGVILSSLLYYPQCFTDKETVKKAEKFSHGHIASKR